LPHAAVDFVRFLNTKDFPQCLNVKPERLPTAKKILGTYSKPSPFLQNSVLVICRSFDKDRQNHVRRSYEVFIDNLKSERFSNIEFEEVQQSSPRNLNGDFVEADNMPCVTQTPPKYEACPPPLPKRQKTSLFEKAIGHVG
jgi:hypothetical protein